MNNGASWTAINNGLTNTDVSSLAISGNNIFAGTSSGVFLSMNNGASWTAINNGLTSTNILSLAISGNNIFAGTIDGVFLSTNNGSSWTAVNNGLTNIYVISFAISGNNIFAGTGSGVWIRPLSEMLEIEESTTKSEFSLFPNPTKNNLIINLQQPTTFKNTNAYIYNPQGQLIIQQTITQAHSDIDISSLAKGMYIVEVYTEKETFKGKIVKE